ncbi:MAG: AmmeMemoRadiSam system protein B [Candidatus Pacearchaeota archaeon]
MLIARYAGSFYPASKEALLKQLSSLMSRKKEKGTEKRTEKETKAKAIIAPHAGYAFSGKAMATAYKSLNGFERVIIAGTNHQGIGIKPFIVPKADKIKSPLGIVEIDQAFISELQSKLTDKIEKNDEIAREHSIEVQLPFLQYLKMQSKGKGKEGKESQEKAVKVVPILVNTDEREELGYLASKIAELIKPQDKLIFSSDFTHYGIAYGFVPFEAKKKELKQKIYELDRAAIDAILALDYESFEREALKTTICGTSVIKFAILIARELNLKPKLLDYYTSSDITKDVDYIADGIVSYASIGFFE